MDETVNFGGVRVPETAEIDGFVLAFENFDDVGLLRETLHHRIGHRRAEQARKRRELPGAERLFPKEDDQILQPGFPDRLHGRRSQRRGEIHASDFRSQRPRERPYREPGRSALCRPVVVVTCHRVPHARQAQQDSAALNRFRR